MIDQEGGSVAGGVRAVGGEFDARAGEDSAEGWGTEAGEVAGDGEAEGL